MSREPAFQSQQPHEAKRAISLPPFNTDIPEPDEIEVKENARRFIEHRTIKAGLDAWTEIGRANSFESWKRIGAALLVGKTRALKLTMANGPWGQHYCREFNRWVIEHHFERMPSPTRSVAIELAEHAEEITAWRDGLPERQRRRLVHPLSVTRRWRAATAPSDSSPEEIFRTADNRSQRPVEKNSAKLADLSLKTARAAYADAIRNLDGAERTAELLQLAALANVELRHDLDRVET